MTDTPKSVWSGTFNVFGVELKCHILDNGQRVIERDSVAAFMNGLADMVDPADDPNIEDFMRWFRA